MTFDHLSPDDCAKEVYRRTLEYLKAGWEGKAIYATISRFVNDQIDSDLSCRHAYESLTSKAINEAYEAFKAMGDRLVEQEKAEYKADVFFGSYFNPTVAEVLTPVEASIYRVAYTAMYGCLIGRMKRDVASNKAIKRVNGMSSFTLANTPPACINRLTRKAIINAELDLNRYKSDVKARHKKQVKQ